MNLKEELLQEMHSEKPEVEQEEAAHKAHKTTELNVTSALEPKAEAVIQ